MISKISRSSCLIFCKSAANYARIVPQPSKNKFISGNKQSSNSEEFHEGIQISDERNNAQISILKSKDLNQLFETYKMFIPQMNIVNYATCLHQALKLQPDKNIDKLLNNYGDIIKEIVIYLEENIHEMQGFTASNFLSNVVKLKLHTPALILKISEMAVTKNWSFNITQASFILWALSNAGRTRNEKYLKYAAQNIQTLTQKISPKDLSNVFFAFGKMKYFEDSLTVYLESAILKEAKEFPLGSINMIFVSYEKYYKKNLDVLEAMSKRFQELESQLTYRNLSNILVSCAHLNYINQKLLDYIEKQLLRKIATLQAQEQEIIDNPSSIKHQTEMAEDLNPTDATIILSAYCKMKVVKTELFQQLEQSFMSKLTEASPRDVTSYSNAHSLLCTEMISQLINSKNQSPRSLLNIKKYNAQFYEVVLPFVEKKFDLYSYQQIYVILISATKPQVKKRNVCRLFISLGVNSLPKLINEGALLSKEDQDLHYFKFFKKLTQFAITEQLLMDLTLGFLQKKIPISDLAKKYQFIPMVNGDVEGVNNILEQGISREKQTEEENSSEKNMSELDKLKIISASQNLLKE